MGKMSGFIAGKGNLIIITVMLCIIIFSGVLLVNNVDVINKDDDFDINNIFLSPYDPVGLFAHKSQYIGDASNINNLLNKLPLNGYKTGISLATDSVPYGLKVNYDFSSADMCEDQIRAALQNNALIVFALIKNVEHITFNTTGSTEELNNQLTCQYSRAEVQQGYQRDLWEYSRDINTFGDFLKNIVQTTPVNGAQIEQAVSAAIKEQGKVYLEGECITEGHVILDVEERDKTVKVYAIASVGWFGFENGIFTKISGSGAIPTVMTLSINKNGTCSLLEYKEPIDGAGYNDSLKKMFPMKLHAQVFASQEKYADLARQQEKQAATYLAGIGRKARVSAGHVDKELVDINVEASNKLFSEFTKYNSFLNSCPYWIGTKEQIENGVRYIYETSQSKTSDGYDVIIFRKTREDGSVIQEHKYKITGSEPQLID